MGVISKVEQNDGSSAWSLRDLDVGRTILRLWRSHGSHSKECSFRRDVQTSKRCSEKRRSAKRDRISESLSGLSCRAYGTPSNDKAADKT